MYIQSVWGGLPDSVPKFGGVNFGSHYLLGSGAYYSVSMDYSMYQELSGAQPETSSEDNQVLLNARNAKAISIIPMALRLCILQHHGLLAMYLYSCIMAYVPVMLAVLFVRTPFPIMATHPVQFLFV